LNSMTLSSGISIRVSIVHFPRYVLHYLNIDIKICLERADQDAARARITIYHCKSVSTIYELNSEEIQKRL